MLRILALIALVSSIFLLHFMSHMPAPYNTLVRSNYYNVDSSVDIFGQSEVSLSLHVQAGVEVSKHDISLYPGQPNGSSIPPGFECIIQKLWMQFMCQSNT